MIYRRQIRIEFNHCDPAGIVFYPRYFEMTNSVAENFFRDIAGHSYEGMMAVGAGVPTARLETIYHLPSRLGEMLDWRLSITRLGNSSIGLNMEAHAGGTHRVTANLTLVYVDATGRPQPWPPETRARITAFQEET